MYVNSYSPNRTRLTNTSRRRMSSMKNRRLWFNRSLSDQCEDPRRIPNWSVSPWPKSLQYTFTFCRITSALRDCNAFQSLSKSQVPRGTKEQAVYSNVMFLSLNPSASLICDRKKIMFAEWSTAASEATRATAPHCCCCLSPCCGPWPPTREDLSPADTDRRAKADDVSHFGLFFPRIVSVLGDYSRRLTMMSLASSKRKISRRAPRRQKQTWHFDRIRAWPVCFLPTGRPCKLPGAERPTVTALKSVLNSWKDDTRKEKNGVAKVAWNKLASRRDGDQRAICFPFCELQTGASHCL